MRLFHHAETFFLGPVFNSFIKVRPKSIKYEILKQVLAFGDEKSAG